MTLTAGDDYTAIDTELTFSESVTRIPFNATLLEDILVEGDEDFGVRLELITVGTNVEVNPAMAPVKILDDDSKFGDQSL